MKKDSVRFTVCIHKELFERLDYVSQFYGCSKSHELRRMIERGTGPVRAHLWNHSRAPRS